MASNRVLLVDDEARFRRALTGVLQRHEYEVLESATGNQALEDFAAFKPDLVLLDLMLPDVDGLTVCGEIRKASGDVAIVVLSVVGDERTKIKALDEGADDYLAKPFDAEELLARIRAVLRRSGPRAEPVTTFEFENLQIDFENHVARVDGHEIRITPIEFSLLRLLAMNPGKLLRHETILRTVWGDQADPATLRTFITNLRSKLGDKSSMPRFIRTVPGLGYRFIQLPAKESSDAESASGHDGSL